MSITDRLQQKSYLKTLRVFFGRLYYVLYILYNINIDHVCVIQKTDDKNFRKIIITDKISHKIFRTHSW